MMLSICVYGSYARGTSDNLSDRDVLIVTDNDHDREDVCAEWKNQGWNVVCFHQSGLKRLADVGALFIQHLKDEANIVRDDNDIVSNILLGFAPKADYRYDLQSAAESLSFFSFSPAEYWKAMCVADVCFVFLRNLIILDLACEKRYVFDFCEGLNLLCKKMQLPDNEQRKILTLRSLKKAYRDRCTDTSLLKDLPLAQEAITLLLEGKNINRSYHCFDKPEDWYVRLRIREMSLLDRYTPKQLDKLDTGDLFEEWKLIRTSNGYPRPRPRMH